MQQKLSYIGEGVNTMSDQIDQNTIGGDDLKDILYGRLCNEVFFDSTAEFTEEKVAKIQHLIHELESLSPNDKIPSVEAAIEKFREETLKIERNKSHILFIGKLQKMRNIAATIAVIFGFLYMTNNIVAKATGFNFLSVVVDFSKSISFSKGANPAPIRAEDLVLSKNTYTELSSALAELDAETPLPSYLPEGISIKQADVIKKRGTTRVEVIYTNELKDVAIRMTYSYFSSEDAGDNNNFSELYTQVDTYEVLGNTVYVYSDADNQLVYWSYENFVVTMQTKLNLSEIRQIMDSIK